MRGTITIVRTDGDAHGLGSASRPILQRFMLLLGLAALVVLGGMTTDHVETFPSADRSLLTAEGTSTTLADSAIESESALGSTAASLGDLVLLTCSTLAILLALAAVVASRAAIWARWATDPGPSPCEVLTESIPLSGVWNHIALRVIRT